MAVYDETDVFNMAPVASVSTDVVANLEGDELRNFYLKYELTPCEYGGTLGDAPSRNKKISD